ncbi:alpha/beta hydrolase [Hyphomonas sp.]|uniref:alpha/beta hydrolase n=1 Tax=Hyphomonas sp. TaxID=87 RepID=UPI00391CA82C
MLRLLTSLLAALMLAGACAFAPSVPAITEGEVIYLWPDGPPGGVPQSLTEHIVHRDNPFGLPDRAAHDVTAPSLTIFRPAVPDGSAILIIPGGGYRWVVMDKEGFEGARHFASRGATVYVLRYRLPHQGWAAGPAAPLQDAQRAMRLIRSRAAEDGIDPDRVVVMGFSAGGHLAGLLATRFYEAVYAPLDRADSLSARPDGAALIYPVVTFTQPHAHAGSRTNMLGPEPSEAASASWSLETLVHPSMPPVLLMHAADDAAVPVENSLILHAALRVAGVPVALHIFETGGHGFGLRGLEGTPLAAWPDLVRDWGRGKGLLD